MSALAETDQASSLRRRSIAVSLVAQLRFLTIELYASQGVVVAESSRPVPDFWKELCVEFTTELLPILEATDGGRLD